jgi:hypothetical protein
VSGWQNGHEAGKTMTNWNQNQTDGRDLENVLDRELDAALAKHASVEPRSGLEQRILANLRAEQTCVVEHTWWRWGLAGALAAVAIVTLALASRSGKPAQRLVVRQTPAQEAPKQTPALPVEAVANNSVRHASPSDRIAKRATAAVEVASANPKLDVFPSPHPLSDEEAALSRYVRDFPQEATLIARAQEEDEIEMQQTMGKELLGTDPTGSAKQERCGLCQE